MERFIYDFVLIGLAASVFWVFGYLRGKAFGVWCVKQVCDNEWPSPQLTKGKSEKVIVRGRIIGKIIGRPAEWCEHD